MVKTRLATLFEGRSVRRFGAFLLAELLLYCDETNGQHEGGEKAEEDCERAHAAFSAWITAMDFTSMRCEFML